MFRRSTNILLQELLILVYLRKKKGMDYCEIFNDNKHTKMLEIEITSLYWSKYCLIMS